jgi:O-antigen/teichoic acid export membrane protein
MTLTDKIASIVARDVILFLTTLLTGAVIARQLGPESMGIWTLILLIPSYAEAFGRLQFDVAIIYFLGKGEVKVGEAAFILNFIAIIMSSLILIVFIYNFDWFYSFIFSNTDESIDTLIYATLCIIPLRFIYLNYSYLLISQEKIKNYNKLVILQAVITSFFSMLFIFLLNAGIMGALLGNIFGLVFSIVYGIIRVNYIERIAVNLNFKLIYKMFLYAGHFYINGLIGFFQGNVTSLISAIFITPTQIAFYAISKSICEITTKMVPAAMNTLLYPKISYLDNIKESGHLTAYSFRITLLILSVSSIILIFLIDFFVELLYGVEYLPLINSFYIMIFGVALSQSSSVLVSYFSGIGRASILPKMTIFPLLVQVTLAIALIPDFGIIGGAIAFSVSSFLLFIFQIFFFIRISGLKINDIMPRYPDVLIIKKFIENKLFI